jgi:hypothetical protein
MARVYRQRRMTNAAMAVDPMVARARVMPIEAAFCHVLRATPPAPLADTTARADPQRDASHSRGSAAALARTENTPLEVAVGSRIETAIAGGRPRARRNTSGDLMAT